MTFRSGIVLVLIEVYTLEGNYNETLLGIVEELTYSELAVLNVLMLNES